MIRKQNVLLFDAAFTEDLLDILRLIKKEI